MVRSPPAIPGCRGLARERLQREGHVRLNFAASKIQLPTANTRSRRAPFLPFAHGYFRTPSGKAELYSEAMKALGLDPVADFTPPAESRNGSDKENFPWNS